MMRLHHAMALLCLVACDSPSSSGTAPGDTAATDTGTSPTPTPDNANPTPDASPTPSPDNPSPDNPSPDGPSPDNPSPDDPSPDNPSPDDPSPDNPGPDGPGPSQCEGDWTLGSTFYHGDDLGTACVPDNAPQNCVSGDFIMFGDGECVCIAACSAFVDIQEGDKCASSPSGDWSCQRIRATNPSANGGLYCVPEYWNLCSEAGSGPSPDPEPDPDPDPDPDPEPDPDSEPDPEPEPECLGWGESCTWDSDCCSGDCDIDSSTCN